MTVRIAEAFRRFDEAELVLCRYLNRRGAVGTVFTVVSRLGDGWFWYALIIFLPIRYGQDGVGVAALMSGTGAVGVVLYKLIKTRAVRERPYITHPAISCIAAPLDRYSFPSGHTLHAVSFALLVSVHFPECAPAVASFAALVALSRVVLGLHYPSDVAAGALLGAGLAGTAEQVGRLLGV